MAENVLFTPVSQTATQIPVAGSASPASSFQSTNQPVRPPMSSLSPSHSFSRTLLIAAGSIGLLLLLIGGLFFYILPRFFSGNNQKVTLVYWGLWEDKKIMQPLIDEFEKQYPNISITYQEQDLKQLVTHNQAYPKLLTDRINAGNGPDIFTFHNTWYPMLSGVLAPFTQNVMTTQVYSNTYFPVVSTDLIHNGAIYGVPLSIDTLSLYVNPDIFQSTKVPADWNDFYTTAKDLTVKGVDGTITTAGAAMGSMSNVSHASDIVGLLLADSDVTPDAIQTNSDNAGKALLYYTNFANSSGAIWNDSLPLSLQMFAKGNLAMYIGYSWDMYSIRSLNPALQFQVYPMPTLFGTKRTLANYWAQGVSIKSKYPQEAMLFMKYLTQKSTQQLFYSTVAKVRGFGEPYARKDLASTVSSNALLYPFDSQGPDAVSSVFVDDTFDDGINAMSTQALGSAITQVSASGSTAGAVSSLAGAMQKIYQQYGQ